MSTGTEPAPEYGPNPGPSVRNPTAKPNAGPASPEAHLQGALASLNHDGETATGGVAAMGTSSQAARLTEALERRA